MRPRPSSALWVAMGGLSLVVATQPLHAARATRGAPLGRAGDETPRPAASGEAQRPVGVAATSDEAQRPRANEKSSGEARHPVRVAASSGEARRPRANEATSGEARRPVREAASSGEARQPRANEATSGEARRPVWVAASSGEAQRHRANEATSSEARQPRASAATSAGSAPLLGPRPWFHASYFLDWGLALGVAGSAAAVALAVKPVTRPFHVDDRRLSLSHREDTVPEWSIAFAVAVPLATAGLAQIWARSPQDFHHAALGLAESMALTFLLTNVIKASVGALRPDFLARCEPDAQGVCTGDPDLVRKGRDSFPSGHTSLFFAGGAYLSLYLWGKLRPFQTDGSLWKILVILSPLVAASLVGASRVTDHRHHWEDVLAGALLGTGFAYLGYRLHFPDPWSKTAGTPRRRTRWVALPVVGAGSVGLVAQGEL